MKPYTGLVPFGEDGAMLRSAMGGAAWREVPPFEATMECRGYAHNERYMILVDRTTGLRWPCSTTEWERMIRINEAIPRWLRSAPDWPGLWGVQRYGRGYGLALIELRSFWTSVLRFG